MNRTWLVGMRLILATLGGASMLGLPGCGDAPEPVRVIAFLDASASSEHLRPKMKTFLEDFVGRLDRHMDKLVIYRLANTVEVIYTGEAWRGPALRNNLEAYIKEPAAAGTSYGLALERATKEVEYANGEGRVPVVLFLGDAEDEPGPGCVNIDHAKVPALVESLGDRTIMSFVFANPSQRFTQTYQVFQAAFGSSYDDHLQFSTPESEERHTVRNFLVSKLKR